MRRKDYILLSESLRRTRPVEGMHSGRGGSHSEKCFHSCYDSWNLSVRDIANGLSDNNPHFDREHFLAVVRGEKDLNSRPARVRDSYPNGECPDCGKPISVTIPSGAACSNCGHVFYHES